MKSIHSLTAPTCRLRGEPDLKSEEELTQAARKRATQKLDRMGSLDETALCLKLPVEKTISAVVTGDAMTRIMTLLDALITAPGQYKLLLQGYRGDEELRGVVLDLYHEFSFETLVAENEDLTQLNAEDRLAMLWRIAVSLMHRDSWGSSIAGNAMYTRLRDRTAAL